MQWSVLKNTKNDQDLICYLILIQHSPSVNAEVAELQKKFLGNFKKWR